MLTLKEICKFCTEAFSSEEVLYGPCALMRNNFPLIIFIPTDAASIGFPDLLYRFKKISACTYLIVAEDHVENFIDNSGARHCLILPISLHSLCDPLLAIQTFHLMVKQCAKLRGLNPDELEPVSKVTNTR